MTSDIEVMGYPQAHSPGAIPHRTNNKGGKKPMQGPHEMADEAISCLQEGDVVGYRRWIAELSMCGFSTRCIDKMLERAGLNDDLLAACTHQRELALTTTPAHGGFGGSHFVQ